MSALIKRLLDLETAGGLITSGEIDAEKIAARITHHATVDEINLLNAINDFNRAKVRLDEIVAAAKVKYRREG